MRCGCLFEFIVMMEIIRLTLTDHFAIFFICLMKFFIEKEFYLFPCK